MFNKIIFHHREHIARHFSDELMDIVSEFPDQTQCTECPYKHEKPKVCGEQHKEKSTVFARRS